MTIEELFQCSYVQSIFDSVETDIAMFQSDIQTILDTYPDCDMDPTDKLVTMVRARMEVVHTLKTFAEQLEYQANRLTEYSMAQSSVKDIKNDQD